MKTKTCSLLAAVVAAGALWLSILPGRAQDSHISAAEFQRLVYSGHLLTVMDEKPELEVSLQVLLELHRRNPNAAPAGLADFSRQALINYRNDAPGYIRVGGYQDEILAAYLAALPVNSNIVSVNLSLIQNFMFTPTDYFTALSNAVTTSDLLHSGNQRLLSTEGGLARRQNLVDACMLRAWENPAFAAAMDGLLVTNETLISVADSPSAIIGNTNSALYGNNTMLTLLALSQGSGDGSLTISSNTLINLFTNETQAIWDTINTNLALQAEFNQTHPDLVAFLNDPAAVQADADHTAAVKAGQPRKLASATAAIVIQSKLLEAQPVTPGILPKIPEDVLRVVSGLGEIAGGVNKFKKNPVEGGLSVLSGALSIFNVAAQDEGESPDETIVREIGNVKTLIGDLSTNINYRFDRVDSSLVTIFDTLNTEFEKVEIGQTALGLQITNVQETLNVIRDNLVEVQADIHALERNLSGYLNEIFRADLVGVVNGNLGYEASGGVPLTYSEYNSAATDGPRNYLKNWTLTFCKYNLNSPTNLSLAEANLNSQLQLPRESTLNYLRAYLSSNLGVANLLGPTPLANPRDWFVGAQAYMQLATENPEHFRRATSGPEISGMMTVGSQLTNFLGSLTFSGGTLNSSLFTALNNYYNAKLTPFVNQVAATDLAYGNAHGVALTTWRPWLAANPPVIANGTELVTIPAALPPTPRDTAIKIAAGYRHSLALKSDGTIVGWGHNVQSQITIPADATNVVGIAGSRSGDYNYSLALKADGRVIGWGNSAFGALSIPGSLTDAVDIAGGAYHGLALRSNGMVTVWGNNSYSQQSKPASVTNVTAIAVGWGHNLVLLTNGTVIGWGYNDHGEATGVAFGAAGPVTVGGLPLTNVVAIAAGDFHSLAIRADGTVVAWGYDFYNQANIPAGLSNVVEIAAGEFHSLALKADGSVVGWGYDNNGQASGAVRVRNAAKLAAAGDHSLALLTDGTVVGWGNNNFRQGIAAPAVTWRGAVASGSGHILALQRDGTAIGWGDNTYGQITIPGSASNAVAVSAAGPYSLALKADGAVVSWGANIYGDPYAAIPGSANNTVAIAAGVIHSLALQANGTIVGWGANNNGQITPPAAATNVVAIAVGYLHSLALKGDGKVVAWGGNIYGQTNVPPAATNVVAIAAGQDHNLALRADGTLVAWGRGDTGVTNIPPGLTNLVAISASQTENLGLKADGTVVIWRYGSTSSPAILPALTDPVVALAPGNTSLGVKANGSVVTWGNSAYNQTTLPTGLTNVVAVSGGRYHSLALTAEGTVVGWGDNLGGKATSPPSATNVVAVATGGNWSLALRSDGQVIAFGNGLSGPADVPASATNVVAIAAGSHHSLALKSDGTVLGWGTSFYGETSSPPSATNLVAIAAGFSHSLGLRADGTVVGWGSPVPVGWTGVVAIAAASDSSASLALKSDGTVLGYGITIPPGLSNVVAIAGGYGLALKADGTVVFLGNDSYGQSGTIGNVSNVVAISAGLLLRSLSGGSSGESLSLVRKQIPRRLPALFQAANANLLVTLQGGGTNNAAALALSGPKSLLAAVLELGLPYTLERDDVLHSFVYGNESLMDLPNAQTFLQNQANPETKPQALAEVAMLRFQRFQDRLNQRLADLQTTGQPEIPRVVGHTMRLLNALQNSWAVTPPSTVEILSHTNGLSLALYGEPYARYTLQQSSMPTAGWSNTTITNLRSVDSPVGFVSPNVPIAGDPQRYYRAAQPVP